MGARTVASGDGETGREVRRAYRPNEVSRSRIASVRA